jgi:hypothetical protein
MYQKTLGTMLAISKQNCFKLKQTRQGFDSFSSWVQPTYTYLIHTVKEFLFTYFILNSALKILLGMIL